MITLWHNPITDEYTLTEDGAEELLSRMAGDFLRDCAINNERLQKENKQLRGKVQNLYALLTEELGVDTEIKNEE